MLRKYIDCREHPSDIKCSLVLGADSEDELMEATLEHVKAVHKYQDTREVREMIRKGMKDGAPLT